MVTKNPDSEELSRLARTYLDLWVEHWGACLASPETSAAIAQILSPQGWEPFAAKLIPRPAAHDAVSDNPAGKQSGAQDEPAPLSAASAADDDRARKLEERIAALERRLADIGDGTKRAKAAKGPGTSGKPKRAARKPRSG